MKVTNRSGSHFYKANLCLSGSICISSSGLLVRATDRISIWHSGNMIPKYSFRTNSSKESIKDPFRITILLMIVPLPFPIHCAIFNLQSFKK